MNIINTNYSNNAIGIDIGNGLMCPILTPNYIPCSNQIQFVIPEINNVYKILLYTGNNILSDDNILLDLINIISSEKVININILINDYLYYTNKILITISTKKLILSTYLITVPYLKTKLNILDKVIDINNHKLKFELIQCTELIKNKIICKQIKLDESIINTIYEKIDKIMSMINTLSNQKLLDIKINLTNKFFLN